LDTAYIGDAEFLLSLRDVCLWREYYLQFVNRSLWILSFRAVCPVKIALPLAEMCMIGMDQLDTDLHQSVARAVEDFENHSAEVERRVFSGSRTIHSLMCSSFEAVWRYGTASSVAARKLKRLLSTIQAHCAVCRSFQPVPNKQTYLALSLAERSVGSRLLTSTFSGSVFPLRQIRENPFFRCMHERH
jgi:hypothetical protein